MDQCYTFHKTVLGYSHTLRDIPCEDASGSFSDEGGRFHIAAVADGHGDATCMRSGAGALGAVQTAVACLTEFAERVLDTQEAEGYFSLWERLSVPKYRAAIMRQLTDTIISRWYAFVRQDEEKHPLSEEELKLAGPGVHAYGTTLIAALALPGYLILIQQGDGRCEVFFEDGSVEQPIPWDERCFENVTTSLCDEDAAEGIRSFVLDQRDRRAAACYLGSDGVEDSYRDMDGTHMFYRSLSCQLHERGPEGFDTCLAEMLPALSKQGSGDDISVAGIVDLSRIAVQVPTYHRQVAQHSLQEQLKEYKSRKAAMERKYGILGRRLKDVDDTLKSMQLQMDAARQEQDSLKDELCKVIQHVKTAMEQQKKFIQQKDKLKEAAFDSEEDEGVPSPQRILDLGKNMWMPIDRMAWEHHHRFRSAEKKYQKEHDYWLREYNYWLEEQKRLESLLAGQTDKAASLERDLEEATERYKQAQDEFSTYQKEYEYVEAECVRIQKEIDRLETADSLDCLESGRPAAVLSAQTAPRPEVLQPPAG